MEKWKAVSRIEQLPKDGREFLVRNNYQGGVLSLWTWDKIHECFRNKGEMIAYPHNCVTHYIEIPDFTPVTEEQPTPELPEDAFGNRYRVACSGLPSTEAIPFHADPMGMRSSFYEMQRRINALIDYLAHQQKEIEELKDKLLRK